MKVHYTSFLVALSGLAAGYLAAMVAGQASMTNSFTANRIGGCFVWWWVSMAILLFATCDQKAKDLCLQPKCG